MIDDGFAMAQSKRRLPVQLRQRLLSWSAHVTSWLDQKSLPVYFIRYEDMLRDPTRAFSGCLDFLRLPNDDPDRLARALRFSSFGALRAQEQATGFREKPVGAQAFFRNGRAGEWKDVLNPAQVNRLTSTQSDVMRQMGYLSPAGEINS